MRIGAQLLNTGATENNFQIKSFVTIYQGETLDLLAQFVDEDQNGLRYVPDAGATVLFEIARYPDVFGTISNIRETVDYSIRRAAVEAFPGDRSVWKIPLTSTDTAHIMSSNLRITLTEGTDVSIALIQQAIKVIPSEGQP
jgi:hypothetical protein